MDRRQFLSLTAALLAAPLAAGAQQTDKVYRIGYLGPGDPRPGAPDTVVLRALVETLRELGYVEGKNLVLERRVFSSSADLLGIAADLVRLHVDVIVAAATPAIHAARQATNVIPIVMPVSFDAVSAGFVATLARPGGNTTGVTLMATDVVGKRVEMLKHAIPHLKRIAVVLGPPTHVDESFVRESEIAAQRLGLKPQILRGGTLDELRAVFASLDRDTAVAALVIEHPDFFSSMDRITAWAVKYRVPTMHGLREFVDGGGLMSYGANVAQLFRRAAHYVDRILKGAKPANLAVEQPSKYELVINLKTAKGLGLTIPPSLLLRADQVIE